MDQGRAGGMKLELPRGWWSWRVDSAGGSGQPQMRRSALEIHRLK